MPIKIPDNLIEINPLIEDKFFVISDKDLKRQNIKPLKIAILNLMPNKAETEAQLLRLIGNTPLFIEVLFLYPFSHTPRNTSREHLQGFYNSFEDIKNLQIDGLIITGAPLEKLSFEEVDYWEELKVIMEWSKTKVKSTFHICWGAQAGLYYHYGIPKFNLSKKIFGVFAHNVLNHNTMLTWGFDDEFFVPHSRHAENRVEDIDKSDGLILLSASREAGVYLAISRDGKQVFVTGHSEYDTFTLKDEYMRDLNRGLDILPPNNYFRDGDPMNKPIVNWRGHGNLLFSNWLQYYVNHSVNQELM